MHKWLRHGTEELDANDFPDSAESKSAFFQGIARSKPTKCYSASHRRRMEIEAKANSRRYFLEKMAAHWDCVADKLIKTGRSSNTVTCVLIKRSVSLTVCTRPGSSVVAFKTFTLKKAGSNPLEILTFFIGICIILFTSRLKAPGSNPLNISGVPCFCIYNYSLFTVGDSNQEPSKW